MFGRAILFTNFTALIVKQNPLMQNLYEPTNQTIFILYKFFFLPPAMYFLNLFHVKWIHRWEIPSVFQACGNSPKIFMQICWQEDKVKTK